MRVLKYLSGPIAAAGFACGLTGPGLGITQRAWVSRSVCVIFISGLRPDRWEDRCRE